MDQPEAIEPGVASWAPFVEEHFYDGGYGVLMAKLNDGRQFGSMSEWGLMFTPCGSDPASWEWCKKHAKGLV